MLASTDYALIAIMILIAAGVGCAILLLTHVATPLILRHGRYGEVKHATYESGVDPIGDSRKRFNVRFYLVAVLFLVFDVEIIFLYPWAVLFRKVREAAPAVEAGMVDPANLTLGEQIVASGHSPAYLLATIGFFFALLLVGFVYEWRKGVFKWA